MLNGCERTDEPLPLCSIKPCLSLDCEICRMLQAWTHLYVKLMWQLSELWHIHEQLNWMVVLMTTD